jgi:flagellar hook-length control protein FliK
VVPDTAIAETVSYWVTHGVQNAELTLEGFGDEAVEVSISLQGDQALVDFRTDQPAVRLALEAANGELRERLASEGLQLAGLTIGASASKQSSGARGSTHTTRQGGMVGLAEQPAGGVAGRSVNPSVGRSLDVFV